MSNENPAVLILSSNTELKQSLDSILGTTYHLLNARNFEKAVALIDSKNPSICIIDFANADSDNGEAINLLKKINNDLGIILICPREDKDELLRSNLSSQAFRVLLSPLSPGQTKLALSATIKLLASQGIKPTLLEAQTDKTPSETPTVESEASLFELETPVQSAPQTPPPEASPVKPSVPKPAPPKATPKPTPPKPSAPEPARAPVASPTLKKPETPLSVSNQGEQAKSVNAKLLIPVIASVGVIAIAAIIWFISQGNKNDAIEQNTIELSAAEDAKQDQITQLLQTVQVALLSNNRFPPKEGNALDSYLKVLEVDPQNQTAQLALTELSKQAFGDLDLQIANGSVNAALKSITLARTRAEGREKFSSMIESLLEKKKIAQIGKAKTALASEKYSDASNFIKIAQGVFGTKDAEINAASTLISAQQADHDQAAEIEQLQTNVQKSLDASRLLEPTQNNAEYFINRLESLDPENADLAQYKQTLASALLAKVDASIEKKDLEVAQRFIDTADTLGADSNSLATERAKLTKAQTALDAKNEAAAEAEKLANAERQRLAAAAATRKAEEARLAQARLLASPVEVSLSALKFTKRTAPNYPKRYQSRGQEGSALISFTVDATGKTKNVSVLSTEPSSATAFGVEAIKAVEAWRFEPYVDENGDVRSVNTDIKIKFAF